MTLLSEIQQIEKTIDRLGPKAQAQVIAYSQKDDLKFPIYKVTLGNPDPTAPVLGLTGGVHGLERIGAQVCVSMMSSLAELVNWDRNIQKTLEEMRIFFIPTVNPVGIYKKNPLESSGC